MHIAVFTLCGLTIYVAAIAYALLSGSFNLWHVVLSGPLIVSGFTTLMLAVDYLWQRLVSK